MEQKKYKHGDIGPDGRRFWKRSNHKKRDGTYSDIWYDSEEHYQKTFKQMKAYYSNRYKNGLNTKLSWNPEHKRKLRIERENKDLELHKRKTMFHGAKGRCKKNGMEFSIELEDIQIPEICPVLGIPLKFYTGGLRASYEHDSPSLDRIDNSKGYIKGNIMVISLRANSLKNDASIQELKAIISYMEKYGL